MPTNLLALQEQAKSLFFKTMLRIDPQGALEIPNAVLYGEHLAAAQRSGLAGARNLVADVVAIVGEIAKRNPASTAPLTAQMEALYRETDAAFAAFEKTLYHDTKQGSELLLMAQQGSSQNAEALYRAAISSPSDTMAAAILAKRAADAQTVGHPR